MILFFGGPGDRSGPMRDYYLGGTQVAFDAIETLRRQLSIELGQHGVRVVTLSSGGLPESLPDFEGRDAIVELIESQTRRRSRRPETRRPLPPPTGPRA